MERVCRLQDKGRVRISSVTTQPTRDGQRKVKCDDELPTKEEVSKHKGLVVLDMEALIREVYESLKEKAEAEEKVTIEPKPRQMMDEEEVASQ